MAAHALAILLPFVVLGLYGYLSVRLRMFQDYSEGRYPFAIGAVIVLLTAIWQALATAASYNTWFVVTAYPWISFASMLVLILGLGLTVLGISVHAGRQQSRRDEVELREGKLSILENLQREARGPYQLLELLNLTLRETLLQFPEACGAVFLVNRSQRMLVLGAASGFTKNEISALEHFPLGNNLVSRAIEVGEPALTSAVDFHDKDGRRIDSRFHSGLVLPLCSGMEKIGAVMLAAEPAKTFTPVDVRYLAPVSDWLAEKIRSARLTREVAMLRTDLDTQSERYGAIVGRFTTLARAVTSDDSTGQFCRGLLGLCEANSVHLFSLRDGAVHHLGGSEPVGQFSESFQTALIDAIDRRKPVVINHESTDPSGRSSIARSSLIFPLSGRPAGDVLMFVRDAGPITVADDDLKLLHAVAALAGVTLEVNESDRRNLTRRVGIEKVLELLSARALHQADLPVLAFIRHLAGILPKSSSALAFVVKGDGTLQAHAGERINQALLAELQVAVGEGLIGTCASSRSSRSIYGKREILGAIEQFELHNRQALQRIFGERKLPVFMAAVPILRGDTLEGVAVFFLFEMPEVDRAEWERLLQLGAGLYSLRLTLDEAQQTARIQAAGLVEPSAKAINDLNNHLSAVIGNAELLSGREEVSGELRSQLKGIIAEAELAATIVREALSVRDADAAPQATVTGSSRLDAVINEVLSEARISGDLYMAGGRPREIHVTLGGSDLAMPSEEIRVFFETVLARFASLAADDDTLTISSYHDREYVYLDVSRHHKNFPPVEPVAGFGEYQFAEAAFDARPADIYLKSLLGTASGYAVDRVGTPPAYLSFRFPVRTGTDSGAGRAPKTIRILAIDDQPVILDLISAMCQSMGYGVTTASTAEAGVRLALAQKYDIILTDLAMPDLSGMEVARQIKRVYPDTPIILVTGWEAGIDPAQLKAAGIAEVLYKPFRIEQLTDIIRSRAAARH